MGIEKSLRSAASSVRKIFQDDFSRVDQTGLGKAPDGTSWKAIRGSFDVSGASAFTTDTNYPLATVEMPFSDVNIELSGIGSGASAALWVTDSGNWVAVGFDTDQVYGCDTCSTCNAWNPNGCTGNWNSSTCNQYNSAYGGNPYCCGGYNTCNARNSKYNFCNSWSCTGGTCYYPFVASGTNCVGNWNTSTCNGYQYEYCTSSYVFSCNCTYSYPNYLRIIRSVAGTISTLASYAISGVVGSLRVKTRGAEITTEIFSDGNLTNQTGNAIVYTPSGVNIETQYGISIKPSNASQNYTIGSVKITKN